MNIGRFADALRRLVEFHTKLTCLPFHDPPRLVQNCVALHGPVSAWWTLRVEDGAEYAYGETRYVAEPTLASSSLCKDRGKLLARRKGR